MCVCVQWRGGGGGGGGGVMTAIHWDCDRSFVFGRLGG